MPEYLIPIPLGFLPFVFQAVYKGNPKATKIQRTGNPLTLGITSGCQHSNGLANSHRVTMLMFYWCHSPSWKINKKFLKRLMEKRPVVFPASLFLLPLGRATLPVRSRVPFTDLCCRFSKSLSRLLSDQ